MSGRSGSSSSDRQPRAWGRISLWRGQQTAVVALMLLVMVTGALPSGTSARSADSHSTSATARLVEDPDASSKRVELPAKRTESSATFDIGGGRLETEFYSGPVFYRPDGEDSYVPIDVDFKIDPAAKRADVTAAPVKLKVGRSGDGILAVEWGKHRVALRPLPTASLESIRKSRGTGAELDALAPVPGDTPKHDGPRADVTGVFKDVGLRVFARAYGATTFLVLDKPVDDPRFTFLVTANGLTLRPTDRGALEIVDDTTGTAVGEMPAPYAVDSTPDEFTGSGRMTTAVSYELGTIGDRQTVTVSVDPTWLAQAVYPVYVDPSTTIYNNGSSSYGDTHVNQGNPTFNYANYKRPDAPGYYEMWLGESPSDPTYYNEDFVKFDLSTIAGQAIDSASMEIRPYHQYYNAPTATNTWIRRVTATWTESITWNTKPAVTTSGSFASGCVEGQQCAFDITSWTRDWVEGDLPNYGVRLDENGNGPTYWKRLIASEQQTSTRPRLIVTYHAPTTIAYPASGPTSSRTLSWTNDASWGQSKFHVDVATDAGFAAIVATSGDVTSAATSWSVPPATTLTEGTTYYWRVRSQRTTAVWGAWSSGSFVPDLTLLGSQDHHRYESWDLGNDDTLSVDGTTLNAIISHPVLSLPIRGGTANLSLVHNAQDPTDVGLSRGWRLNALRRLAVNPGNGWVTLVDDTGARHTFSSPTGSGTLSYTRPSTIFATLVRDTAPTPDRFTLTYRDRTVDVFDELVANTGFLIQEKDRSNNTVSFGYSGTNLVTIDDPAGRRIDLTWASGRLTQVQDWAYVSGGEVQATATGSRRAYRFFYDASNRLAGWADPANTSSTCPATPTTNTASHVTCIGHDANGYVTTLTKAQTIAAISGGAITTLAPRSTTTQIDNGGTGEARDVRDAEQFDGLDPATTFRRTAGLVEVIRKGTPDSTTRYAVPGAADTLGRITSVKRKLVVTPTTYWIEELTAYDATYPTEPASVTDNQGAQLSTPARTVSTTYVPSSLGLVQRLTEPLDGTNTRTTDYTYNANNDVTQKVVALNGSATQTVTKYSYTAATGCAGGVLLCSDIANFVSAGPVDEDTNVTTDFQYDGSGQRTRETRHNRSATGAVIDDRATAFEYDTFGNLTREIGNVNASPTYDGSPDPATGARTNLRTSHRYDTAGNRMATADPRCAIDQGAACLTNDHFVTRWTFDPLDQPLTEKTPTTPTITITCAPSSPSCRVSSTVYDELGRVLRATDFGNLVTATEFDRAGRATQTFEDPPDIGTTKPADTSSQATFDASGRMLTTKDQIQVDDASRGYSSFVYDELGRQLAAAEAVTTAAAAETDTAWDALDRQKSATVGVASPTSQTTVTTYDLAGRAIKVDDEFACTTSTYDYRDFLTQTVEGLPTGTCTGTSLRTIAHTPDGLARLTRSQVTAGAGVNDIPLQQSFDSAGRVVSNSSFVAATSTTTSATTTFNPLDQVIVETRSDGSRARTNYDAAGNQTDRCYWAVAPTPDEACQPVGGTFTTPPTRHTSATFDARNNRVSLTDATTKATTIYDPDHNYLTKAVYVPTKMTGSNVNVEHQSTFSYDERHRLTGISHQTCARTNPGVPSDHACSATSSTGSLVYEYDLNANRTRVDQNNGASATNRYYCYDPLERLQYRNTGAACSSTVKDETYVYDDAGNRTQTVQGAVTTTFGYDPQGQLCKVAATSATDCASANVTYDSAGRTATYNGWWYVYDAEGRLITACKSATCATTADKVEMVYDAGGRRTKIISDPANATPASTREFRYQGDAIVEERVDGVVDRQYLVDESGSIVEMVIASGASAGTYLVTYDGHGDAMALWKVDLTTGSLTLANAFTYTTWGAPTTTTHNGVADLGFRFLYVGEFDVQWDNVLGLGLTYMHARHYSPALGRFIQPDPDRSEANPYAYAANNPITEVDPSGTCFIVCAIINAVVDTAIYLATTDSKDWSIGGVATAAVTGAVTGALGVGLLSKFAKIGTVARAIGAGNRAFNHVGRSIQLARWTRATSRGVDRAISAGSQRTLRSMGAHAGDARMAVSGGRGARLGRGNIIDGIVKDKARGSRFFRDTTITRRGQRGVDFDAPGIFSGRRVYDVTTRSMKAHHRARWPGVKLFYTR